MTPQELERIRILLAIHRAMAANQVRMNAARGMAPQMPPPRGMTQPEIEQNRKQTDAFLRKNTFSY